MERRAVQEYQNYFDMQLRSVDAIPRTIIRSFSVAETVTMAWQSYQYFQSLPHALVPHAVALNLLLISETEWTLQEKLFEVQKVTAKLPKETFLVLKSTFTHLCRIAVAQKRDPDNLFQAVSNAFAPVLFRVPSRQNSIYREEKYLAKLYPDKSQQDRATLSTTQPPGYPRSYDSLSNWKGDNSDCVQPDDNGKGGGRSTTTYRQRGTQASRTVRVSIQSGALASSAVGASVAPEIDNLWDGDQVEAGGEAAARGFRSESTAQALQRVQSIPLPVLGATLKAEELPAEDDDEKEEEQFNEWVRNQMQEASRIYKERKWKESNENIESIANASASASTLADLTSLSASEPNLAQSSLPGSLQGSLASLAVVPSELGNSQPLVAEAQEAKLESSFYLALSVKDTQIASSQITALLTILEEESNASVRSDSSEEAPAEMPENTAERFGSQTSQRENSEVARSEVQALLTPTASRRETIAASNTPRFTATTVGGDSSSRRETQTKVQSTGHTARTSTKTKALVQYDASLDFKIESERSLATSLFAEYRCSTALGGILEIILQNMDTVFDWNMQIERERHAAAAVQDRLSLHR
ncbi:hypothetical protein HDU81_003397 [Chytriomyces hyalinus]|nr:hypothetical protein HDU81_003397 [Chytriomyces hyalinus]